jgi:molybdopterin converting factor small subunit
VTGRTEVEWKLDRSLDADGLWARLSAEYPGLDRFRDTVRLAKNCEYADAATRFDNGDEVALIPPVSGG